MNKKGGLNLLDFLATGINKQDPAIRAILSDENGEGAVANETEALAGFIDYYTRTGDVRNHRGGSLEMITGLFARQRRRLLEDDGILLRRFLALTERGGDTIWGNVLNMKHVIEAYFTDIVCHVAESTGENNMLDDGDFESDYAWTMGGGAARSHDARFSGRFGVCFGGAGGEYCAQQQVDRLVTAGVYTLHFFLNGRCGVVIENDGRFWNANPQRFSGDTVLAWEDEEVVNLFESPEWNNVHCFIVLSEDTRNLTVRFTGIEGSRAYIDYVRLFPKPANPSYTLVIQYEGYRVTEKTLHLAEDGEDPVYGVDYENESYFDNAFVVGPAGVSGSRAFRALLDTVRPLGIEAFVEFVGKETIEQEEI